MVCCASVDILHMGCLKLTISYLVAPLSAIRVGKAGAISCIYIYIYIYYVAMVTAGLYIAYTPHQYST